MSRETLTRVNNSTWLDLPASITPTSLTLPKNLSYEKWAEIGPKIARIKRFTSWALADWLNYGEARYGETYAQAVEATGFEANYLAIVKYVGGAISPSRRHESLSFSHHRSVASLEAEEQERFLAEAETHGWSREDLATAVRNFKRQIEGGDSDEPLQLESRSDSTDVASEQLTPSCSSRLRARRIAMALDWIAKWQREGEEMGLAKFDDLERRSESIEARSHALRSTRSELEKIDFHSLEYGCALINRIREWGRIITDMILLRVEGEFQLASFMVHRKIPPEVGGRICKKNDRVKALCRTMRRGSIEFCQIALAQYFADLDEDVFSWDEFGLGEESQDAA